jgi:hypothetical protein
MAAASGCPDGSFIHGGDPGRFTWGWEIPIGIQSHRNVTAAWGNSSVVPQSRAGGP